MTKMGIDVLGKQIEAVVFDFDGTLYENGFGLKLIFVMYNIFHPGIFLSHRKVIDKLRGSDFGSSENYRNRFFGDIAKQTGKSLEIIQNWYFELFKKSFCSILKRHCKPRKHFKDLCRFLKENQIKTAVFSDYGFIGNRLDALNIEQSWFDLLISGESEGVLKPGARPLLKIASQFGLSPEKVLVVGDRIETDGKAAINAGMNFLIIKKQAETVENTVSWKKFLKMIMNDNKFKKEIA